MTHVKLSDRPWNDPGPGRGGAGADQVENEKLPILHAIVLDFSSMCVYIFYFVFLSFDPDCLQ